MPSMITITSSGSHIMLLRHVPTRTATTEDPKASLPGICASPPLPPVLLLKASLTRTLPSPIMLVAVAMARRMPAPGQPRHQGSGIKAHA